MPALVRAAVLLMVAALTFYTVGVWSGVISGRLRPWHAGMFWAGLLCDATGTDLMRRLAGGLHWNLHTGTGLAALLLMLTNALWATVVLVRRDESAQRLFPRGSIIVWGLWLIPFVTGMVLGRRRGL